MADVNLIEGLMKGLLFVIGAVVTIPVTLLLQEPINDLLVNIFGGFSSGLDKQFAGEWKATYTRLDEPKDNSPEYGGEEIIVFRQLGKKVTGKKLGEKKIRIRGTISKDKYLTGYWYDTKKRAHYFGACQFIMYANGKEMIGKWVGFSDSRRDHIRHGNWTCSLHRDI